MQHLRRMLASSLSNFNAPEHARDFFHALLLIQDRVILLTTG
jgi:hypothetical protein